MDGNMGDRQAVSSEVAIDEVLSRQTAAYLTDINPSAALRRDRLDRLERMILAWQARFASAISEDFGNRSAVVTTLDSVGP